MNWYPNLYTGERAAKKKETLIQKIESGKTPVNTYLLTLPPGEANQLEILPVWNLKFWCGAYSCPLIVGLGCGKSEAFALVQRIAEDVLRQTGSVDLRGYFTSQCL